MVQYSERQLTRNGAR